MNTFKMDKRKTLQRILRGLPWKNKAPIQAKEVNLIKSCTKTSRSAARFIQHLKDKPT